MHRTMAHLHLNGKLRIDGTQISVHQLTGTFAASVLDGSITYAWGERDKPAAARRLTVELNGSRIDARALLPQRVSFADLMQALSQRGGDAARRVACDGLVTQVPDRDCWSHPDGYFAM